MIKKTSIETDNIEAADRLITKVDACSYQIYLDILDKSPDTEGFRRLMNEPKPWRRD